jgi:hypothetical protein
MCTVVNCNNSWDCSELRGVTICEGSGMQGSKLNLTLYVHSLSFKITRWKLMPSRKHWKWSHYSCLLINVFCVSRLV